MLTAHSAVAARALPAQRCISGVMLLQALRRQPSPADARAGITGVLLLHLPPPPPPVLLTVSISSSSCTPPAPVRRVTFLGRLLAAELSLARGGARGLSRSSAAPGV